MADLIVLAGSTAVEKAASDAGIEIDVPFFAGRMDALQEQTDAHNISFLEPYADGFRNYTKGDFKVETKRMLIDRAHLLDLSAPEMTALVGGLRVLGANYEGSDLGVFTDRVGVLTNDFFVNLLDVYTEWAPTDDSNQTFEGKDSKTGQRKWTASRCDLVFGSNLQLRAVLDVFGASNGGVGFQGK